MNGRRFLSALSSTVSLTAAQQSKRPNILLVVAVDLGYECLGCNGGTFYRTPNLGRMAAQGARFTHGYAQPLLVERQDFQGC